MPQADSRSITSKIPLPKELSPGARAQVEKAIEAHAAARDALIAFLDEADGEPDFEPCVTNEPHDEDTDREPSLAHTLDFDQARAQSNLKNRWFMRADISMDHDLEAEHDGREPQCEDEGAACDDEGVDTDREPRAHPESCGGSYGAR